MMSNAEIDKLIEVQAVLSGCEMPMQPCNTEKRGQGERYSPFCRVCKARDMITGLIVDQRISRAMRSAR